jgi:pimeloyl-ACP methyl ester carboxylesterase
MRLPIRRDRPRRPLPSAPRDDAALRDHSLPDIDWSLPPDGAILDVFAAPSGHLARMSMGDPRNPPVLLVPGVTGSKEDFSLMMPDLAAAGWYAVSFDMAGQYQSAEAGPERLVPARERYDHALFVGDLIAMMEDGGRPAHVLGYSFAGTVAQLALVERPDLFESLSLLSCPPLAGNAFRGIRGIGRFSALATARAGASLMVWGIRRNFTKVSAARLAFIETRFQSTRRSSIDDVIGLMKHTPDLTHDIAALRVPVFVAIGSHDLWREDTHREYARAFGGHIAIYDTGHSPCETTPHQLARDLDAFYRGRTAA